MSHRLKQHLSIHLKCWLVGFCSFVMGGLITVPLYALLHAFGWLGQDGSQWANDNKEFMFKMFYLLSMLLSVYLLSYLQKLFGKTA